MIKPSMTRTSFLTETIGWNKPTIHLIFLSCMKFQATNSLANSIRE
jgi:hypothetical protein